MEKIVSGIKYKIENDVLNIEIPAKITTINNSDGIYKLMNAKDLSWGFVLDQIKRINPEILNLYKEINVDETTGDKFSARYINDNDNINDYNLKPLWYKNGTDDGIISSSQELCDLINFILYRYVYIEDTVQEILNKSAVRKVKFTYSNEIDKDNNDVPDSITITLKPVYDIDPDNGQVNVLGQNIQNNTKFTVSTSPKITDENFDIRIDFDYDVCIQGNEKPILMTINKNKMVEGTNSSDYISWDFIVQFVGFNLDSNVHNSRVLFNGDTTTKTELKEGGIDDGNAWRVWDVTVKKTTNPIEKVIINDKTYIYFGPQEIYDSIYGNTNGNISKDNILYYPCIIEEALLKKYIINGLIEYNETTNKYKFIHDSSRTDEGTISWFIDNGYIYSYPYNNQHNCDKFNCINLKNVTSNTIEIITKYPVAGIRKKNENGDVINGYVVPPGCNCLVDTEDTIPIKYFVDVKENETSSSFNEISKEPFCSSIHGTNRNNTTTPYELYNFEKDLTKKTYKFEILSKFDNTNTGNKFVLNFETSGTKYIEQNKFITNDISKDFDGNPLSLIFNVSETENLFFIGFNELKGDKQVYNETKYDKEDYPFVENILKRDKENNNTLYSFANEKNFDKIDITDESGENIIDTVNVRPIKFIIPIISKRSFNNYENIYDRNYNKSEIVIWESGENENSHMNRRLFNITNYNNINIESRQIERPFELSDIKYTFNEFIEIDYNLSWKYYKQMQTVYNLEDNNFANYDTKIITEKDISDLGLVVDINNAASDDNVNKLTENIISKFNLQSKKDKQDYLQGEKLISNFIKYNTSDDGFNNITRKWIKTNKTTTIEKNKYIENYIDDEKRFFVPVVLKIPKNLNGGNGIIYDDTYFVLHLIITRGKPELKCLTIKQPLQAIKLMPYDENINEQTTLDTSIKFSYIYNPSLSDFTNFSALKPEEYNTDYLRLISRREMVDDGNGPKLKIGFKKDDLITFTGFNDVIDETLVINVQDKKYPININCKILNNEKIICNNIIDNNMDETSRWYTQNVNNVEQILPIITTTDSIYSSYNDSLLFTFKKNDNLLPLSWVSCFTPAEAKPNVSSGDNYIDLINTPQSNIQKEYNSYFSKTITSNKLTSVSFNLTSLFNEPELFKKYFVTEDIRNDVDNDYYTKFKTEIKACIITNKDDEYKHWMSTDITNITNLSDNSDIEINIDDDKNVNISISNITNYNYNNTDAMLFVLYIWFPQTSIYTGRYYKLRLSFRLVP